MINRIYNLIKLPLNYQKKIKNKNISDINFNYENINSTKIFSTSLFFNNYNLKTQQYLYCLKESLNNIKISNSSYIVRLYINNSVIIYLQKYIEIREFFYYFLTKYRNYIQLYYYDHKNIKLFFGSLARFFPIFDKSILEYHIRDLDNSFGNYFDLYNIKNLLNNHDFYLSTINTPTKLYMFNNNINCNLWFPANYLGGKYKKSLYLNRINIIQQILNCSNYNYGIDEIVLFNIIYPNIVNYKINYIKLIYDDVIDSNEEELKNLYLCCKCLFNIFLPNNLIKEFNNIDTNLLAPLQYYIRGYRQCMYIILCNYNLIKTSNLNNIIKRLFNIDVSFKLTNLFNSYDKDDYNNNVIDYFCKYYNIMCIPNIDLYKKYIDINMIFNKLICNIFKENNIISIDNKIILKNIIISKYKKQIDIKVKFIYNNMSFILCSYDKTNFNKTINLIDLDNILSYNNSYSIKYTIKHL